MVPFFASSCGRGAKLGLGRVGGIEGGWMDGRKQGGGRAVTEGTIGVRREHSVCLSDVEFDGERNADTIFFIEYKHGLWRRLGEDWKWKAS